MVGTQLIQQLIASEEYSEIISLVRRPSETSHPKLSEYCVDFDKPDLWKELISGDVLFSTMGTTLAQAKGKDQQFKVDYTYQYNVAKIASENGVPNYVLISSAGASSKSLIFYSNMKGELEDAVKKLPFQVISILQPGQLKGIREINRSGEKTGVKVMEFINKAGLFKKYKPIDAIEVAQAMINAANHKKSSTYTLYEVFKLAEITV
jgi:uncharacterized protein YbjT (DUF2867 family)